MVDTNDGSTSLGDLVEDSGQPFDVDDKFYWYLVRSGRCAYDLFTKAWSIAYFPIHDHEEYFSIFEPQFSSTCLI